MEKHCLNCGNIIHDQYCACCGQKAATGRLDIHFLWHEIQHSVIHIDKGILYTARELCIRPGHTVREFIEGKRIKHFRPLMFLFVLAGLYGFLHHYFNINTVRLVPAAGYEKVNDWVVTHYAIVELINLPVYSLATWLAFRKWNYNYIEHVVLNAFVTGQRIILNLLMLPLLYYFNGSPKVNTVTAVASAIGFAITCFDYAQFFKGHPLRYTILRIVLAYLYFFSVIILIAIVVVIGGAILGIKYS
ncbi:MAG: DUF3667 domain-containing protein [Filimonas sp.]|nr:DUF3667 domain-containing protein [Filimonas sp.]